MYNCKFVLSFSLFIVIFCCIELSFGSIQKDVNRLADKGQFPHQVLLKMSTRLKKSQCGGSLISKNHVLTAANCLIANRYVKHPNGTVQQIWNEFVYMSKIIVILGATNLIYDNDTKQEITVNGGSDTIILHPDHDRLNMDSNIALIRLSIPAKLNKFVNPIALPLPYIGNLNNQKALVSGWGVIIDLEKFGDKLLFANVTVLPAGECEIYNKKTEICTIGIGGNGTCNGDLGGPLTYRNSDGADILIGILSYGWSCKIGGPSHYTRVSQYTNWIIENIKEKFIRF